MTGTRQDLAARLAGHAASIETMLVQLLDSTPLRDEIVRPQTLLEAMRHGALDGGKRLRPFLVMESAALFGVVGLPALRAGAALECIHCYSLIHDDLPAMDDDDLRRGKPTVHKAFGEAAAILAGDALLTMAFDVLADPATHENAQIRCELVTSLARAAGIGGMAGGQMLDLDGEGQVLDAIAIAQLQAMKTGALLRHACEAGAILGGAGRTHRQALSAYGKAIGKAFQLADDILDVTASAEAMGKHTAKDSGKGKPTLVSLMGIDAARAEADWLVEEAVSALAPFGESAEILSQTARFIVERGN